MLLFIAFDNNICLDRVLVTERAKNNGEATSCFHACSCSDRWSNIWLCSHSGAIHGRVLRPVGQQPPVKQPSGGAVQVGGHPRHAHLWPPQAHPGRHAQLRPRPPPRRRQRQGLRARRQPLQRGGVRPGLRGPLLPGGGHPAHRRRQRTQRLRHGLHRPGDAERPRLAGRRRPHRCHQGVHVGELLHRRSRRVPAVERRVRAAVHGGRGAVPGDHGRAAAGQRVPVLRLRRQPGRRHQPRVRDVPAGRGDGDGPRKRADVQEPVRRHGGRRVRGAGQGRGSQRQRRRVRERVAVGRRVRRELGERAGLQPAAHQPHPRQGRAAGHAEEAREDGDVRLLHVQRGPQDGGSHGEALRTLLRQRGAGVPHQLQN